jgi:hypothetical protein
LFGKQHCTLIGWGRLRRCRHAHKQRSKN